MLRDRETSVRAKFHHDAVENSRKITGLRPQLKGDLYLQRFELVAYVKLKLGDFEPSYEMVVKKFKSAQTAVKQDFHQQAQGLPESDALSDLQERLIAQFKLFLPDQNPSYQQPQTPETLRSRPDTSSVSPVNANHVKSSDKPVQSSNQTLSLNTEQNSELVPHSQKVVSQLEQEHAPERNQDAAQQHSPCESQKPPKDSKKQNSAQTPLQGRDNWAVSSMKVIFVLLLIPYPEHDTHKAQYNKSARGSAGTTKYQRWFVYTRITNEGLTFRSLATS
jgi:hypothetical protein